MTTWLKQKSKSERTNYPSISIRRLGLGINSRLIEKANAEDCEYAEVYVSSDNKKLAIKFLREKTDDSYNLTQDGGSKDRSAVNKYLNRFIACGNVVRSNELLKELSNRKGNSKLVAFNDDGMWVANIIPAFIHKTTSETFRKQLSGDEMGVYKYVLNEETIYIGKGCIKQRLLSPERKDWKYDHIEYMVLTSSLECSRIESDLLKEHKSMYGVLPPYNKIMGIE